MSHRDLIRTLCNCYFNVVIPGIAVIKPEYISRLNSLKIKYPAEEIEKFKHWKKSKTFSSSIHLSDSIIAARAKIIFTEK